MDDDHDDDDHDDDDHDDKVQQGLEHLQAAAREMIQATRSLLDAAEELVEDPRAIQGLLGTLGGLAQAAAARMRSGTPPGDGGGADGDRVQPIRVS